VNGAGPRIVGGPRIDAAGPVRPGEELPVPALDEWLKAQVPGLRGTPEVTQYSGGVSNWTYRLAYESHDLVLRRPPAGTKAKSAHDMRREHRVQAALHPHLPYVPEMIAFCDDSSVIGAEFYVMRRIAGVIPRKRLGVALSPADTRELCERVVDTLVSLHRVDVVAVGLADLGRGPGYARRQVEGWTDRYARSRTWNVPTFRDVTDWLAAECPDDVGACVIHNDFRFDNLVLDPADPKRIVGLLDWEMATIGDPLMDLGGSLAYWVQADDDFLGQAFRRQPTHLPGMLTRREVVDRYCRATGRDAGRRPFYDTFGLFRLAVIAQQIYYRYHHRQTRNPAYRWFWIAVRYLHRQCTKAMRGGR
jgi:aminoglycoside phosphotransferase (APT) family kinase protein